MKELRLAGIIRESVVDGPGWRFTVFTQGCPHHCPGCHNPQTHDFNGGFLCTVDKLFDEIMKNPLLKGVTFSGGEPFCQADVLAELGKRIKNQGKDLITYTGFVFEELWACSKTDDGIRALLEVSDYLIDGPFLLDQRDLTLSFRGSRNQRIIDLTKSLQAGHAILTDLK